MRLDAALRARHVEGRQRAMHARVRMGAKDRNPIRAFDEFHRRGPARVHFDGIRDAIAGDDVHAVHARQNECVRDQVRHRCSMTHQRLAVTELRITHRR